MHFWSRPFGTCICSTCWDQSFFRTCRYFYGLCSSNIPRYFLDFASLQWLKAVPRERLFNCPIHFPGSHYEIKNILTHFLTDLFKLHLLFGVYQNHTYVQWLKPVKGRILIPQEKEIKEVQIRKDCGARLSTWSTREIEGDPTLTKTPLPTENSKINGQHNNATKTSITKRLRTDLGWSVGITTAIQLMLLNWFTGTCTQPSNLPQKPCNQKNTHLKVFK